MTVTSGHECYLNLTGGICPITACSKSLVNGQCYGCKDGKCEVDSEMEADGNVSTDGLLRSDVWTC